MAGWGSGFCRWPRPPSHDAVAVAVLVPTTFGTFVVDVYVRIALVTHEKEGNGRMVIVGLKLNRGTVVVLVRAVDVTVVVEVTAAVTIGVKAVSMVKVGVTCESRGISLVALKKLRHLCNYLLCSSVGELH